MTNQEPAAMPVKTVFQYHLATKHHFHRYARNPGRLDWATQPNPFRRYQGAPLTYLEILPPDDGAPPPSIPAPLNLQWISQLFYDSLAISAWKQSAGERWALRVNPSSGNLHPTEGYLICGAVPGLSDQPGIWHYAPREHGLELRAAITSKLWSRLTKAFPGPIVFVGLSSIPWREAWKYGERAFRYCNHDVGHALAALRIAAAGLGWQALLVDELSSAHLATLLGLNHPAASEQEHPDCLLAFHPHGTTIPTGLFDVGAIGEFAQLQWLGQPNQLSSEMVEWPWIAKAVLASQKPENPAAGPALDLLKPPDLAGPFVGAYSRRLIHQRRSAVAMDGATSMSRRDFYAILRATLPDRPPFDLLAWPACVSLALFVHRVNDLAPGLYLLARNPALLAQFKALTGHDFAWCQPPDCPPELPLHLLQEADAREASMMVSCHQDIASDGCFSLGMVAEFDRPIRQLGPWFYPRLFWECGMVGQVLYLEAERAGFRGTGIGCFFDDPMHQLLGLRSMRFQSLYHFTIGGPLEDTRITSLPSYPTKRTKPCR